MLSINECIILINECFEKSSIKPPINVGLLNMNLSEVDLCLDCVSNILCDEGFDENSEPNYYGIQLEIVIDFLNHIRYSIVDGIDFNWD